MVLRVRDALEEELTAVRAAVSEVLAIAMTPGVEAQDVRDAQATLLAPATGELDDAFGSHQQSLVEQAEEAGDRCRGRKVTLTLGSSEPDGVLRAAAEAARMLTGPPGREHVANEKIGKTDALGGRMVLTCRASVRRLVESA